MKIISQNWLWPITYVRINRWQFKALFITVLYIFIKVDRNQKTFKTSRNEITVCVEYTG